MSRQKMRLPLPFQDRKGVREKHNHRKPSFSYMHHCTEGTDNLNFFELKLLCPWLHNCANIGLVSSWVWICSPRQGHLHRPVADVVPSSPVHKWMVWKGMKAEIVTSCHLTPWLVSSWDACLPSALQGTAKVSPPVGQKNASGKGGDMSCLESLGTITAVPCFVGREGNAVFVVLMQIPLRSALSTTALNVCVNFCSTGNL